VRCFLCLSVPFTALDFFASSFFLLLYPPVNSFIPPSSPVSRAPPPPSLPPPLGRVKKANLHKQPSKRIYLAPDRSLSCISQYERRAASPGGRCSHQQRLQQVTLTCSRLAPPTFSFHLSNHKHPRAPHPLCSDGHGGDEGSDTWDDWQCDADTDATCPSLLPPFQEVVPAATAIQQAAESLSFNLKEAAQSAGVRDIYGWISFVNWCRRSLESGCCPKCGRKEEDNLVHHMSACKDDALLLQSPWAGNEQFLIPHRQEDGLLSLFSDDFSEALSDPAAQAPTQVKRGSPRFRSSTARHLIPAADAAAHARAR
jgi:hypothetical protein